PMIGFFTGLFGLILLSVPFIAEMSGGNGTITQETAEPVRSNKALLQLLLSSALVVTMLKFWIPLKFLGIFQGDYLASFALLEGSLLLFWNFAAVRNSWNFPWRRILGAVIAAIVLVLLFGLWFDYGFYEAWLTSAKWLRMVPVVLAFFPWLFVEE